MPWFPPARFPASDESDNSKLIILAKGEVRRVAGGRGVVGIDCREGCVWVTQSGDPRDLILQAGEVGKMAGRGLVLVESLRSSVVRIFPLAD